MEAAAPRRELLELEPEQVAAAGRQSMMAWKLEQELGLGGQADWQNLAVARSDCLRWLGCVRSGTF